ncbi:unnamed protein product [Cyclocybe aegerita]|uniref:Uncharacterized protein n=1 Tax=Cyclocybe aegerita TaxID=1973307 RepID=A0A8S0XYC4_CYCAE|nr:unnamed protein product [Cyclocybe aegerita]
MLDQSQPRKGHTTLKSTTLQAWMYNHTSNIVTYAWDDNDSTNRGTGMDLLTKHGLFHELKNQVVHCKGLERTPDPKLYYGRHEILLMFKYMLAASASDAFHRMVGLQNSVRILFTFVTTCRSSTLGPTEKKYADYGEFICLKDVKIIQQKPGEYTSKLHFHHFKGSINTVEADEQRFTIQQVLYAHNATFDLTTWLIADLFARNAFAKKFLKVNEGASSFMVPYQPSPASAHGAAISHMAKKAGLPPAGSMAIRHESGNRFGIAQGIQYAKDVMNHHTVTDGIYRRHYSMNTDNFQPQAVVLGEVAGANDAYPGQQYKIHDEMHALTKMAVQSLLRIRDSDKETNLKASASPEMVEVLSRRNEVVEEFIECFTGPVMAYDLTSLAQLNNVYNEACEHADASISEKGLIMFKDGMRGTAATLHEEINKRCQEIVNKRRAVTRKLKREADQKQSKSLRDGHFAGTVAEAHAALAKLDAIAEEILPTKGPHQDFNAWKENLERSYLQEAAEAAEDEYNADDDLFKSVQEKVTDCNPQPEPLVVYADGADLADESLETDTYKLPIREVLDHLLHMLLEPIFHQRHDQFHSPWMELELAMVKPSFDGKYHCPAGCNFSFESIVKVRNHAVSDMCAKKDEHLALKLAHQAATEKYNKYEPHAKNIRDRRKKLNAMEDSDEEDEFESAKATKALQAIHDFIEEGRHLTAGITGDDNWDTVQSWE